MTPALLAMLLACGSERATVKNATDMPAGTVIIGTSGSTTVAELRALPAPSWNQNAPRHDGPERTEYLVNAWVIGFKLESDNDFHIVIADEASGPTMIAEIPDPACANGGAYASFIAYSRRKFVGLFGQPVAKYKRLARPVLVQLRGFGFFDKLHGQTGVAPNGIEIHPVTSLIEGYEKADTALAFVGPGMEIGARLYPDGGCSARQDGGEMASENSALCAGIQKTLNGSQLWHKLPPIQHQPETTK